MHQFVVTDDPACEVINSVDEPVEPATFRVYPVPSWGELNLEAQSDQESVVSLVDLQGRVLRTYKLPPFSGRVTLDAHEVPAGMYLLHWKTADGKTSTRKIVLQ